MRTTDDLNPERFQGLGEKVAKPAPAPIAPKPQGASGFVTEDGKTRTTSHKPHLALTPLEQAIWSWRQVYAEEALLDFLP